MPFSDTLDFLIPFGMLSRTSWNRKQSKPNAPLFFVILLHESKEMRALCVRALETAATTELRHLSFKRLLFPIDSDSKLISPWVANNKIIFSFVTFYVSCVFCFFLEQIIVLRFKFELSIYTERKKRERETIRWVFWVVGDNY